MTEMTEAHHSETGIARRLPLIVIAMVALAGVFTLRDHLSFEALAANRELLIGFRDSHFTLTLSAFLLVYVCIVAFSLPGATVATLTGGFLFGTLSGTAFNVVAATAGATLIFLAVRAGMGDWLVARMDASEGRVKQIKRGIDENQWSVLFLIRLVPVVPFFVANILPALVGVPLWRFVITTFFGIIPGAVVYTSVGAGLGDVFARGESPDLGIIFEPKIFLPILGLCALVLLPVALKALRSRKLV